MNKKLSNLFFIFKCCFTATPKYMGYFVYDLMRNQIMVFLEHTLLIRYVLKCVEYHEPFYKAAIAILIVFVLYAIQFIPDGYWIHVISNSEKPKLYRDLRRRLYEKAAEIDLSFYDNPQFYNDFVLVISESDKTMDRFLDLLSISLKGIFIFLTTGIFYLMLDPMGIIFLLLSYLLSIFCTNTLNKVNYSTKIEENLYERKKQYGKRIFFLCDTAKEVRMYPEMADKFEHEYYEASEKIIEIEKKVGKKRMWLGFLRQYCLSDFVTDGLYMAYLIYKVIVLKSISYSDAIVLFHRTGEIGRGMNNISSIIPKIHENDLYISKIKSFLQYSSKLKTGLCEKKINNKGDIVIENLSFRYDGRREYALKNISLKIKQGEHIAIVGFNGAGKTTLVKLLMRLYDATEGSIYFDGINIKEIDVEKYRSIFGVVFQDYQIFGATISENVALQDVSKFDNNMKQAITTSLINSGFGIKLSSLENGIDTVLTTEFDDEGINLSGGESQKVATARCFFKDASILIMDEPSSSLDPICEYELNQVMERLAQGKTVFFISHRLSTIKDADRIIMMENGEIIEEGTHNELLELNGKYANMWKKQAIRYK